MNFKNWPGCLRTVVIGMMVIGLTVLGGGCRSSDSSVGPYARPAGETGWEDGGFMTVTPEPVPPALSGVDQKITDEIWRSLREDPTLAGVLDEVKVEVNKGAVRLRGTVPSDRFRNAIVQNIQPLPGVSRIQNDLKVNSDFNRS